MTDRYNFRRPLGHDQPKFETEEDGGTLAAVVTIHEREKQMKRSLWQRLMGWLLLKGGF